MAESVVWAFFGYQTPAGGSPVQEWFDGLSEEERDEALDSLSYLQTIPLDFWGKPDYEPLGDGLSEIRFKVALLNKTIRIYGFFWPGAEFWEAAKKSRHPSYTFLLGKEKKVKRDATGVEEARKRKGRVERGEVSVHAFKFS